MAKESISIETVPNFKATSRRVSRLTDFSNTPTEIPMRVTSTNACLMEEESGRRKTAHSMESSNMAILSMEQ